MSDPLTSPIPVALPIAGTEATVAAGRLIAQQARFRRLRTMAEFAEQEVVLPTGPYQGLRFNLDRNPFSRLLFREIDSGHWRRIFATGPQQSGKTLNVSVIPLMYHLFEIGETAIYGVPTLDMVAQKWQQDLRPVIAASKYADQIPDAGQGSRGGRVEQITFRNGATLLFRTGGGSDKKRAGFTSRILGITEVDGMDTASAKSREGDRIGQLEGRVSAFENSVTYGECTVTIEAGRTWHEYTAGTESRVCIPCPHCGEYVTPEREHLVGWQDAADVLDAKDRTRVACPACGAMWTNEQRIEANRRSVLAHRGQTVLKSGEIEGPVPRTDTLGFRWNAINNLLVSQGEIGAREWRAAREPDETNATKKLLQFTWARPYKPDADEMTELSAEAITKRVATEEQGDVPKNAAGGVIVTIDLGKYVAHWTAGVERTDGSPHVVDYGTFDIPSADMAPEKALFAALRTFRDGVIRPGIDGKPVTLTWIDSGYLTSTVYAFCKESGPGFMPTKGFAVNTQNGRYREPKKPGGPVAYIGHRYHLARVRAEKTRLVELDADHWKAWLHGRLATPIGQPGAMTLYQAEPARHMRIARHITAEKQVEVFIPGKGVHMGWRVLSKSNHWLDCLALFGAALDYAKAKRITVPAEADQGGGVKHAAPSDLAAYMGRKRR